MYRVGLTGNVASGKSTVAKLFSAWGAIVIDADQLARDVVAPGTAGYADVAARFPSVIRDDAIDRAALRRIVMQDSAERAALNAIVHPRVQALRAVREAEAARADAAIVVHDIPLLFEVLDPGDFDAVVLVDARPAERRRRLVEDRGLSPAEADALLAAQAPSEAKRGRSTYVLDNDGTLATLETRARGLWRELQERAATV